LFAFPASTLQTKGIACGKLGRALLGAGFGERFALNPRLPAGRAGPFAAVRQHGPWSLLEMRFGREHLLVQNAHDQHFAGFLHIKHNVLANLKPAQSWTNRIAGSANGRVSGQKFKTVVQLCKVLICLPPSPGTGCIGGNQIDVLFGLT
jgi:hypothetical protein